VLFAVSDDKQRWLGWYYFAGQSTIDELIMAHPKQANHKVLGFGSAGANRLRTKVPMTVEELAGPILWSQRGKWQAPRMSGKGFRRASMSRPVPDQAGRPIRLHIALRHDTGHVPFDVKTSKVSNSVPTIREDHFEIGFVNFLFSEPFAYPVDRRDDEQRLRFIQDKLTRD
jgi:hypothetical protein